MDHYCYDYPRPAVTVDAVVFGVEAAMLKVLLIRRGAPPFQGMLALPGGFMGIDEAAEHACRRELLEETHLPIDPSHEFEAIGFYDRQDRDPRGRTLSLAFATVVATPLPALQSGDDASNAEWFAVDEATSLAFDHDQIIEDARRWLEHGVEAGPIGLRMLPETFNRDDARALFRAVGLPLRHISKWLGKLVRFEIAAPLEDGEHCYRRLDRGRSLEPDPT